MWAGAGRGETVLKMKVLSGLHLPISVHVRMSTVWSSEKGKM